MLFGPDALAFRVDDSGASVALCDEVSVPVLQSLQKECQGLQTIFNVPVELNKGRTQPLSAKAFQPVQTMADDPAILIYTSGTTGNPKGALIPQRALIGNLTGFIQNQPSAIPSLRCQQARRRCFGHLPIGPGPAA
jgi:acetyl-CoA synthetase